MNKYEKAVRYLNDNGMDKKLLLGMVYGLYQDYKMETEELDDMYELIDPDEQWNDVSYYWEELEEHADEFFACIDKLPEWSADGEWYYNGEDIMNFSEEDLDCLADLFEEVVHDSVHTGLYEEEDGTGYSGMAYLHFD